MPKSIFAIVTVAVMLLLGYPVFKKVIFPPLQPEHLETNPQKFRYERIYDQEQLAAVLEAIIKEGMSKEEIDAIFVEAAEGGADSLQEGKTLYYKYTDSVKVFCGVVQNENSEWKFAVQYDENNKTIPFESKKNKNVLFDALWPCF